MINFSCMEDLMSLAESSGKSVADIIVEYEAEHSLKSDISVKKHMSEIWQVMKESADKGVANTQKSVSGMVGGDAKKLFMYESGYCSDFVRDAAAYAVAVAETNAVMGKIAACPTAGSCGIVPGVLLAAQKHYGHSDERICQALFTATGIGMVIENNAMIAGAQGGCQAECGSAAGMAAGALADLAGGDVRQIGNAVALAIKNLLGLACDPVAGLVEVPCVKRNGFAATVAVLAADMSLAGINSVIPVDEVIDAMYRIGRMLPEAIRETAQGGLATTCTGLKLKKKIYND
ncbi:L-serine ammonia-lyase, iron-sulfur-dependent, subunit alpha [Megamonas hypermegale]|uniref:L-serine ammonia-lyase, iron-sulfur-dependent, subunit alpha n=1 Tax=Megamonas hypermegale TaxID=158847 RepID=UPI0026F0EDF4|nr:L-serine ammonia-lyase, iron-sulfur-dependent, subunit alpha [Megamonas hypermegale]